MSLFPRRKDVSRRMRRFGPARLFATTAPKVGSPDSCRCSVAHREWQGVEVVEIRPVMKSIAGCSELAETLHEPQFEKRFRVQAAHRP